MSQRKINITIALLVVLLIFVILYHRIVKVNGPAVASIIYNPLTGGLDSFAVYKEGAYLTWPWNTTYEFNLRQQKVDTTINILMQNGVTTKVQINYRYYPIRDSLVPIFRNYGVDYGQLFVKPEVESAVRIIISDLTPEQLYKMHFDTVRLQVLRLAKDKLRDGDVTLEDLVILNIELPKRVVDAIESKLEKEQLAQEYDFREFVAMKQKDITVIEAAATRMAEDTINGGLTQAYLQLKQIDAFQKLSVSPNAKTIIVPQGTNNPVIVSGQ